VTSNARPGTRIVGSLRSADGAGVVRVEERYATDIDDLWSALTDPDRLARWYGQVDGELGLGGEFRMYVDASGWEGTGRVEACEPPRRLMVTTKELSESFRKTVEATLTSEDDHTVLVIEVRGMPLDKIAFFGAGWQIHTEDLAAYLAGGERGDTEARWDELVPPYQDLASGIAGLGNA
jgi:uncharacterized protein YndB with AHSA1/START domain